MSTYIQYLSAALKSLIKEPFLLVFCVLWILFCLVPKTIRSKGTSKPIEWQFRIGFTGAGVASLVLWYSLP
jgi:hypothetical protein